jgi:transcriptional regulator with XRE-family HTH domain
MPTRSELGRRLREQRVRQSLTLKQVENKSGVSATHISQIERGITWPTVHALERIARALEKNTSFFLEEVELPDVCTLCGDGKSMVINEKPKVVLRTLTHGIPGGQLHFYVLVADPAAKDAARMFIHSHEGDECGCVVSGEIEVKVGDKMFKLGQGDSIHFDASRPHGIRNIGNGVSESGLLTDQKGVDKLGHR